MQNPLKACEHAMGVVFGFFAARLGLARTRAIADLQNALQKTEARFEQCLERQAKEWDGHRAAELERARLFNESITWLAGNHSKLTDAEAERLDCPRSDAPSPRVTVVTAVRNESEHLAAAIDSILAQTFTDWELIVVDDGSDDPVEPIVRDQTDDLRIRFITLEPSGVVKARNRALEESRGELIAYLDADNTWKANFLTLTVAAFDRRLPAWLVTTPDDEPPDCVYMAQIVKKESTGDQPGVTYLRGSPFDREVFERRGGIDLNTFAHRRECFERHGGFDPQLTRLVDWDLVARYCGDRAPAHIHAIGGCYRESREGSITDQRGYFRNAYIIRRKLERLAPPIGNPPRQLRVLYALWHFPQLTESYVRWEIEYMRRRGIHVEVWSEMEETNAPFEPTIPVHYGPLESAIAAVRPDVAHIHWCNSVFDYRDVIARSGVPITVRSHGFEFSQGLLERLQQDPTVARVFLFPHFALQARSQRKLRPLPAAFDGSLYYPEAKKDRRLVVRTGCALPTKDYDAFIETAVACPNHRFVLAAGISTGPDEKFVDEIAEKNKAAGNPVEIRVNLDAPEISALIRKAGIYLHTFGFIQAWGEPMSICEAMATGAYTIVRRCDASIEQVGSAAGLYDNVEEAAALINETLEWDDASWAARQHQSIENAYRRNADIWTLDGIVEDWLAIAESRGYRQPPVSLLTEELSPVVDHLINKVEADHRDHRGNSFISHLAQTYELLESWGYDRDVCLAGLYHSVYGTMATPNFSMPREIRPEVKALIGDQAEYLAYWNCAIDYEEFEARIQVHAADPTQPIRLRDRFTGREAEFSAGLFRSLCAVHLADGIEQMTRNDTTSRRRVYRAIAGILGAAPLTSLEHALALADRRAPVIAGGRAAPLEQGFPRGPMNTSAGTAAGP